MPIFTEVKFAPFPNDPPIEIFPLPKVNARVSPLKAEEPMDVEVVDPSISTDISPVSP